MPKLKSSGSRHSQFVDYQNVPAYAAEADSSVVLAAYNAGLEALLSLCGQENEDELILNGMYQSLAKLTNVREMIDHELAKSDVMLDAIRAKLLI